MTKMAAMSIYGKKNLKNLLLWNRWTDFNETRYTVASGPIIVCINHDLALFYGKINFGHIGFSMEISENIGFFGKFCSL